MERAETPASQPGSESAAVLEAMRGIVAGAPDALELSLTALMANGQILIEDVPGVGKTTLARTLARCIGASFKRIQFTSDMLPADIVGVSVWNREQNDFEFKPGPIFAGVVLADEINRTTPRTQSALLEAMSEHQVTVDGVTHELPAPFLVIATQNPLEHFGTYPLPESQMDRFLVRITLGYPGREAETDLLVGEDRQKLLDKLQPVVTPEAILRLQQQAEQVTLTEPIVKYILDLVEATRQSEFLELGVSPRGAILMHRAARAYALLQGRDHVLPDDVQALAGPVFAHRVLLRGVRDTLRAVRDDAERVIGEIVGGVEVPV